MLWYFYSNAYSLAREGTPALMVTGSSARNVRQECPFRLLRVEVLKTRIAHPPKTGLLLKRSQTRFLHRKICD